MSSSFFYLKPIRNPAVSTTLLYYSIFNSDGTGRDDINAVVCHVNHGKHFSAADVHVRGKNKLVGVFFFVCCCCWLSQ